MNEQKRLQNCVMNTRSPNIWRYKLLIRLQLIIKFTTSDQAGIQYVAPGPDEKDANVYFLPQKNSSELKFVLQFTVTFP